MPPPAASMPATPERTDSSSSTSITRPAHPPEVVPRLLAPVTAQPAACSSPAQARPMPADAPVTSTRLAPSLMGAPISQPAPTARRTSQSPNRMPGICGPGRMRWFQHTVPDLTGRWIPTASHPQRDGALQPGAGGPLPWHLHVISTGSTAGLHTGLVGCGDIDDGGVGQGSHDPAGIAAVGLVHPGGLGSDPVQGAEYDPRATPRSGRPGTSSCTDGRQGMLLTTTSTLQDRHIDDYKGVVSGEAILGANAFRDMFAGIRDIVGGRSAAYERELQKAKDLAISEMVERARDTGANAVIGIDLDYETVGQNGSMLMVTASGTAVVVT